MTDKFFDDKNYRKNKIRQDQLDKNKHQDEDKKVQHKKTIEHKKQKEEIEEDEWEYWKNFYK
jgi:hypothetical protein